MSARDPEPDTPRWLRLAAAVRAEPEPDTLARVRARLARAGLVPADASPARRPAPAWVRWLARPAALATTLGLLVVSAWAGSVWLSLPGGERGEDSSLVSALLGEDGSYGLRLDAADDDARSAGPGAAGADSGRRSP